MDLESKNKGPRACTTCAKAKSRCIPGPAGTAKCERCHRLHKLCGSQTPAPPRAKKDPKPTKVAELERRLDDLTSQLQAAQSSTSASLPSPPTSQGPPKRTYDGKFRFSHLFPTDKIVEPVTPISPTTTPQSEDGDSVGNQHQESLPQVSPWPLPEEAAAILETYHKTQGNLFPFVLVPRNLSALELSQQRPLLYKAVMMVTMILDGPRQMVMGYELIEEITRAAFTNRPQKSLDLLQGLELVVAWFHYAINSYQLTNLLFLARSICVSFGIKPVNTPDPKTLEYMRAFAGCYYLNTLVFTTNKRPDVFMNTGYLDTCSRVIEEKMEVPSDELLIQLIRIQRLAHFISFTLADSSSPQSLQLPLVMVVQSFQQQLDDFKASLSPNLQDDASLLAHISIAEVLLYEIAIPEAQSSPSRVSNTERLEMLWSCLLSAKRFLNNRFAPRDLTKPSFICLSSYDFVFSFITCLKLLTLKEPGWDIKLVKEQLGMMSIIDLQISEMVVIIHTRKCGSYSRELAAHAHGQGMEDPFERLLMSLHNLKTMLQRELELIDARLAEEEAAGSLNQAQPIMQDLEAGLWGDFWDDPRWILDEIGPSEWSLQ